MRQHPLETNKSEISNCPICGGISFVIDFCNLAMTKYEYQVCCHKGCQLTTVKYESESEAKKAWENKTGLFYFPGFDGRLGVEYKENEWVYA